MDIFQLLRTRLAERNRELTGRIVEMERARRRTEILIGMLAVEAGLRPRPLWGPGRSHGAVD